MKQPALFNGQRVRLKGKVVGVQDSFSPRGRTTALFDLADSTGNTVRVLLEKRAIVQEGMQVTVEGKVTLPYSAASSQSVVVEASRLVPVSFQRKASPEPTAILQPQQSSSPSSPAVPVPSTPMEEEGRVF